MWYCQRLLPQLDSLYSRPKLIWVRFVSRFYRRIVVCEKLWNIWVSHAVMPWNWCTKTIFVIEDFCTFDAGLFMLNVRQMTAAISTNKSCNTHACAIWKLSAISKRYFTFCLKYSYHRGIPAICKYYRVSPQHTKSFPLEEYSVSLWFLQSSSIDIAGKTFGHPINPCKHLQWIHVA